MFAICRGMQLCWFPIGYTHLKSIAPVFRICIRIFWHYCQHGKPDNWPCFHAVLVRRISVVLFWEIAVVHYCIKLGYVFGNLYLIFFFCDRLCVRDTLFWSFWIRLVLCILSVVGFFCRAISVWQRPVESLKGLAWEKLCQNVGIHFVRNPCAVGGRCPDVAKKNWDRASQECGLSFIYVFGITSLPERVSPWEPAGRSGHRELSSR